MCVCERERECLQNGWCLQHLFGFMQISLQHFTTVAPLLKEDLKSSEIPLLPRAVAMVQKQGTSFPLHHRITVEGSWPKAHCYISCEGETRSVKGAGLKPKTADAETVSSGKSISPTGHQQHGVEAG